MTKKIVINGKEYASPEEMPPEIRSVYDRAMSMLADKDENGVPDAFEGKGLAGVWQATKETWQIAQDARQAGIQSFELREPSASRPTVTTTEHRIVTSYTPGAPTEVGGGNLRKVLIAIIGATAIAFLLQQLGVLG